MRRWTNEDNSQTPIADSSSEATSYTESRSSSGSSSSEHPSHRHTKVNTREQEKAAATSSASFDDKIANQPKNHEEVYWEFQSHKHKLKPPIHFCNRDVCSVTWPATLASTFRALHRLNQSQNTDLVPVLGIDFCVPNSDKKDVNINQWLGYDFDTYLSGTRNMEVFISLWHIFILTAGFILVTSVLSFRLYFDAYINFKLRGLPGYKTYLSFVREPNSSHNLHNYSTITALGDFFFVANLMYLMCTLVYTTYRVHRSQLTLPLIAVITSILLLGEGLFANILYNKELLKDMNKVEKLQKRLQREYIFHGNNEFSVVQNHMSIWLRCCGIVDVSDFNNVTLTWRTNQRYQVPPSCCKRDVFAAGREAVLSCMKTGDVKSVYQKGCMEAYMDWAESVCNNFTWYIWIHVVDCLIHAWIYKRKIALNTHAMHHMYPQEKSQQEEMHHA